VTKLIKVLFVLSLLLVTGCAGSLGWDRSTPLPSGSFRESRGGPQEFYSAPSQQSPCGD
jgi:hypothetical protein